MRQLLQPSRRWKGRPEISGQKHGDWVEKPKMTLRFQVRGTRKVV